MAQSNQSKRLTESSTKGTLFIVNNDKPFLDPYFTTTVNSTQAVKEFFSYASSRLSAASKAALQKISKTAMLNAMVQNHDLIVVKTLSSAKEALEDSEDLWIVGGVDGYLTAEEVASMIEQGELDPDQLAAPLEQAMTQGDEVYKPIRDWEDFEIQEPEGGPAYAAGTGLGTAPEEVSLATGDKAPQEGPVRHFIFVSREAKPRWAPGILKVITHSFDIRKNDVFKWVQTVQAGGTVIQGEYSAKELLATGRISSV